MSNHKKNSDSLKSILPLILTALILPPLGIALLVLKALENVGRTGSKVRVDGQHPYSAAQQGVKVGARTTAPQQAQEPARKQTTKKSKKSKDKNPVERYFSKMTSKAKRLTTFGGIVSAIFLLASVGGVSDALYWLVNGDVSWFFEELLEMLPVFCFLGGGLGTWWAGRRLNKTLNRQRQYLAMIGTNKSIPISSLATAAGRTPKEVREDLQTMLDEGLFPAGFLDFGGDRLVLSAEGLKEDPAPQPQAKPTKEDQENIVLNEIRIINDEIQNPKISAQIDRIGIITAKIFDYQKSHPGRAPELHSFLSYYLPTTLKILRSYAQLEDQGVKGENITAAMGRIEAMMDKVVEGFEKQLDQLFHSDVLDITADVQVLEQMLKKDGLSGGGIQLTL